MSSINIATGVDAAFVLLRPATYTAKLNKIKKIYFKFSVWCF